jgi:hypothetical protein
MRQGWRLKMTLYRARMLDADTGSEGVYDFEHREDLFDHPTDEIIEAFFEHADRAVMSRHHVNYEINGCMNHRDRGTVVAIGQLILDHGDRVPFTLIIGKKEKS